MAAKIDLNYFKKMTIPLLKDYLSSRGINQTGNKNTLAQNAYYAYCLNIPVEKTDEEEMRCFQSEKKAKLSVNGLSLPDPKTLTVGWIVGSSYFPNVTYEKIKTYLEGEGAAKAFRGGRSLFDSGHIKEIRYHLVSEYVSLCYVMCSCIPEQRTDDPV